MIPVNGAADVHQFGIVDAVICHPLHASVCADSENLRVACGICISVCIPADVNRVCRAVGGDAVDIAHIISQRTDAPRRAACKAAHIKGIRA